VHKRTISKATLVPASTPYLAEIYDWLYSSSGVYETLHQAVFSKGTISHAGQLAILQEKMPNARHEQITIGAKKFGGVILSRGVVAETSGLLTYNRYHLSMTSQRNERSIIFRNRVPQEQHFMVTDSFGRVLSTGLEAVVDGVNLALADAAQCGVPVLQFADRVAGHTVDTVVKEDNG